VIRRGIVLSISVRPVGRFEKAAELPPHRRRYWLNANPKDPQELHQQVAMGQVIAPTMQPTRDEKDFAEHLARAVTTAPKAPARFWIFLDRINFRNSGK
jgi:hypothetical protein